MNSPDLQNKYHKLAAEYSKLKGQNQVLKKAVIEEQGKSNRLKENVKFQDQSLRKAEQELDSLNFRNQQLTKRLILLQEDLERYKVKNRKGHLLPDSQYNNSMSPDHEVHMEELQSKIKENAALHIEISELEKFYKRKMIDLELKFQESNVSEKSDESSKKESFQDEIHRLEKELVNLESQCTMKDATIAELHNEISQSHSDHISNKPLQSDNETTYSQVLFAAAQVKEQNIEVTNDRRSVAYTFQSFSNPVKKLSAGFVKFFASYASLLKVSPTTEDSQPKLVDQLLGETTVWDHLFNIYDQLCSSIAEKDSPGLSITSVRGMEALSRAVSSCSSSLRKLLPIFSERTCSEQIKIHGSWRSAISRLVSNWSSIVPYLTSLAAYCEKRTSLTVAALNKILDLLHERISKLHFTTKDLLSVWDSIDSKNCQSAFSVRNSLRDIESAFGEICGLLSEILPIVDECDTVSPSPSTNVSSPGTSLTNVTLLPLESALRNSQGSSHIGGSLDESFLVQQLSQATARLSSVEQELEHWRLEHHLSEHRLGEDLQIGEASIVDGDLRNREKEIRDYFTNRCSLLHTQISSSTSQAALYQDECEALMRRLTLNEELLTTMEQDADHQRDKASELQETLTTTSRNYEEQISTMSDYLADLNDKVSRQADQIEELKFDLKKKGKK